MRNAILFVNSSEQYSLRQWPMTDNNIYEPLIFSIKAAIPTYPASLALWRFGFSLVLF